MRYYLLAILIAVGCNTGSKNESEKKQVRNGRVPIAYDLKGNGDTLLVLVHGWAINKTYWKNQIDTFSKRFTVAAIDLGGHGESGKNRDSYSLEDYTNDILAVINSIKAEKIILVGHSMSGDIVLNVANTIPGKVKGIIGIDNFKSITTQYSKQDSAGIDSFTTNLRKNYKEVVTEWCYKGLFPAGYKDSSIMKNLLGDVLKTDSLVSVKTIESMILSELGTGERLQRLSIPLYVITSEFAPVDKVILNTYSKNGFNEKIIKGTGHYPMVEKPGEFNRLLFEIIDEIAKAK